MCPSINCIFQIQSFQVALTTSIFGESFVIFNYGQLTWSTSRAGVPAQVTAQYILSSSDVAYTVLFTELHFRPPNTGMLEGLKLYTAELVLPDLQQPPIKCIFSYYMFGSRVNSKLAFTEHSPTLP